LVTEVADTDCPLCRGELYVLVVDNIGYPGHVTAKPCPDPHGVHCRVQASRLAAVSGLLPEEMGLRLSDLSAYGATGQMVALAQRFVEKPWGFLTLWGGYGNGKTLVLQAIINEFRLRHRVIGAYVRLADLLDYVRAGYDRDADADARERYERFKTLPVLAIDECDGPRLTAFAEEFRRSFLDDRYRLAVARRAHTVFAMNCDPATLPGDLYDRLRDGRFVIFHNTDPSMRPAARRVDDD
jgi:DNA replication protein DnaC